MYIEFLQEPELEFGVDRHIDVRFGLSNYGPVDFESALAPKSINLGIVGTNETIEGVSRWLERCRDVIPAKPSKQPNLFPSFPGFRQDIGFQSTIVMNDRLNRDIHVKRFRDLALQAKTNEVVRNAVELFYDELKYLAQTAKVDVFVCAVPQELLDFTQKTLDSEDETSDESSENAIGRLDFHNLLKARAMDLNIPLQLIVPSTYDETKRRRPKTKESTRKPQDEATRAWNLHTALYYKAKGVPWRLVRTPSEYSTCYVGISFYKALDGSKLLTSMAQVFNERGEGFIVRGGHVKISKDDKQVHLERQDASTLLRQALLRYKEEHRNFPARLVVHKTSSFSTEEVDGFVDTATSFQVEMNDFISIDHSRTRLFRVGSYPPLRGLFLGLDENTNILYTRGSVDFFQTYPGLYVPRPLRFRCESTDKTPVFLAAEMLALTKMNWNNTQFDGGQPITIRAARQVSEILKYIPDDGLVVPSYRFYM